MTHTTSLPGGRCITEDLDHYSRSVGAYDNRSVTYEFQTSWLKRTFPEEIVNQLRHTFPRDKELRMLNIGSGSGEIDCTMLQHIRAKFESITNHVVEPSGEMLTEYKTRADKLAAKELTGVRHEWHQQTLDEYMKASSRADDKFHLISAMHSLYYAESQEVAIDYLYDQLAEGGLLVIMMQDNDCGYLKLLRRFPLHSGAVDVTEALPNIYKHLDSRRIAYHKQLLPATYDVTPCYQHTEEGAFIVDFLSHVMNFEKVAPTDLKNEFLDYVKSSECSTVKGEKVLLNSDEVYLLIQRGSAWWRQ